MNQHMWTTCTCCTMAGCQDSRCALVLPSSTQNFTCISGRMYQANHGVNQKLCDCIILWSVSGGLVLAPVELKSGGINAKDCVAQLQNGANLANTFLSRRSSRLNFAPLLVHRGGMHPIEYRILNNRRVLFRGKSYPIQQARCGSQLANLI